MNWYRIRSAIRYIPDGILAKVNPCAYARKRIVTMKGKGGVLFYGIPDLSTDPWSIEPGDNVHITKEDECIINNGGRLLFRHGLSDSELTKPIKVDNNVNIGIQTMFLPEANIEENSGITAGSVVTIRVFGSVPSLYH